MKRSNAFPGIMSSARTKEKTKRQSRIRAVIVSTHGHKAWGDRWIIDGLRRHVVEVVTIIAALPPEVVAAEFRGSLALTALRRLSAPETEGSHPKLMDLIATRHTEE